VSTSEDKWKFVRIVRGIHKKKAGLTADAANVLTYLALHSRDGSCFPGQELLADETGVPMRSLRRAMRLLEEKGYVRAQRRLSTSSRYFLTYATLAQLEKAHSGHPGISEENPSGVNDDGDTDEVHLCHPGISVPATVAGVFRPPWPIKIKSEDQEMKKEERGEGETLPAQGSSSMGENESEDPVKAIFGGWVTARERRAKDGLSPKLDVRRRAAIASALETFTADEVKQAVEGFTMQDAKERAIDPRGFIWALENSSNIEQGIAAVAKDRAGRDAWRRAEVPRVRREPPLEQPTMTREETVAASAALLASTGWGPRKPTPATGEELASIEKCMSGIQELKKSAA
jgi:DNA-binding MarR family transcriptional regulator